MIIPLFYLSLTVLCEGAKVKTGDLNRKINKKFYISKFVSLDVDDYTVIDADDNGTIIQIKDPEFHINTYAIENSKVQWLFYLVLSVFISQNLHYCFNRKNIVSNAKLFDLFKGMETLIKICWKIIIMIFLFFFWFLSLFFCLRKFFNCFSSCFISLTERCLCRKEKTNKKGKKYVNGKLCDKISYHFPIDKKKFAFIFINEDFENDKNIFKSVLDMGLWSISREIKSNFRYTTLEQWEKEIVKKHREDYYIQV